MLCSWYNNWTSILIEDIFKDHTRVIPTVGKIKQVDFFVDGIPFDLKMTYFPGGFMKKLRQERGLVSEELSELKKAAKDFQIPFDSKGYKNDLIIDLITAFYESSDEQAKTFYKKFISTRREIINQTISNPRQLLVWLYENQGNQRFDASNRLFLVVIDRNYLEDSWKIKRDYQLLKREIESYLDSHSFNLNKLLIQWYYQGRNYQSYTDVLFVFK
ncbi:MAG: hypothetical protein O4861_18135 [Trichodesmium sp. St16_bin4-tuft]|nr:hypothetical protein [Trichodesmium sp. St4_bin8_1]MDE5073454.1 hypothetical protein [Trichodesmium sp. St5_bin8]MDE5100145.1 hypothetical protein [Trichodesmium sp. St16_bin4-tuft]MDE5102665.1 hypothetical protein [Trichodesmium sp. St19_bin2]